MAFNRDELYRVGPTNDVAGSVFKYTTTDAAAVVEAADYFLDAINELPVGTWILCNLDTDGTPAYRVQIVTTNDGTTITVTPSLTLT